MKKTFSLLTSITIVFLMIGVGCQQTIPENTTKKISEKIPVSFEKKQECATYKTAILNELNEKDPIYGKVLDEIFYSPSKDSCLYAYTAYPLVPDGIKNIGIDYTIVDYLTNETVAHSNSVMTDTAQTYYIERKEELKK